MGKATISSNLGAGQYNVVMEYNHDTYTSRIAEISASITAANAQKATLQGEAAAIQLDVAAALADLTALYAQFNTAGEGDRPIYGDAILIATAEYLALVGVAEAKNRAISATDALIMAQQAQASTLTHFATRAANYSATVWCADYTDSLVPGTVVGTIEPFRARSDSVSPIIHPGGAYGTSAAYSAARDGIYTSFMEQPGSGALFNLAMSAGADKWLPRYRIGTVVTKGTNSQQLQEIALDSVTGESFLTKYPLDHNQAATLYSVQVSYMGMSTNEAFNAGDRVVIRFTASTWNLPVVIGFESHPVSPDLALDSYSSLVLNGNFELLLTGGLPYAGGAAFDRCVNGALVSQHTIQQNEGNIYGAVTYDTQYNYFLGGLAQDGTNPRRFTMPGAAVTGPDGILRAFAWPFLPFANLAGSQTHVLTSGGQLDYEDFQDITPTQIANTYADFASSQGGYYGTCRMKFLFTASGSSLPLSFFLPVIKWNYLGTVTIPAESQSPLPPGITEAEFPYELSCAGSPLDNYIRTTLNGTYAVQRYTLIIGQPKAGHFGWLINYDPVTGRGQEYIRTPHLNPYGPPLRFELDYSLTAYSTTPQDIVAVYGGTVESPSTLYWDPLP